MSMYAIVLFFIFAGILSVKDKLIKNDSITTESFEEDEMIEDNTIDNEKKVEAGKDKTSNNEKKNTSPNDTTLNNSESNSTNKLIKVTTNSPDMKYCDPEIINDIKKNFSKKVDNMKNKLNDDISVFKRIIESPIVIKSWNSFSKMVQLFAAPMSRVEVLVFRSCSRSKPPLEPSPAVTTSLFHQKTSSLP